MILKKLQQRVATRLICGYSTISYEATLILVRMLSVEYQAKILQKIYLEMRSQQRLEIEMSLNHRRT